MSHSHLMQQVVTSPATPESLGRAIRVRRIGMRMLQRDFARLVGCDRSTVSYVELGKRRLDACELARWAIALETTPNVLLMEDPLRQ